MSSDFFVESGLEPRRLDRNDILLQYLNKPPFVDLGVPLQLPELATQLHQNAHQVVKLFSVENLSTIVMKRISFLDMFQSS